MALAQIAGSRAIVLGIAATMLLTGCATDGLASPIVSGPPLPPATSTPTAAMPEPATETPEPSSMPVATIDPASSAPASESDPDVSPILGRLAMGQPAEFDSTIECEGPIGESDPLAIVRLRPSDPTEPGVTVLRDYANVSQPRTACTFGGGGYRVRGLIDPQHVLIDGPRGHAVVDLPDVRYHWFQLPRDDGFSASLIAVAPDLSAVIWRKSALDDTFRRQIFRTDALGDHAIAELPAIETGRCGSSLDSRDGAYSRTGDAFYVLDQPYAGMNVLLAGSGSDIGLTLSPPGEGWDETSTPLMALWSPTSDTLYYRVGDDVMHWSPGAEPELFLADTPWSNPTFTPDGRHLAYAMEDGIHLVDMTSDRKPRLLRSDATQPIFLNSSQLWFRVAQQDGCVPGEVNVHVYDVTDNLEFPSIVDDVISAWPATSARTP
jgi:hypothetical protein